MGEDEVWSFELAVTANFNDRRPKILRGVEVKRIGATWAPIR
jgi:hypothetical protein